MASAIGGRRAGIITRMAADEREWAVAGCGVLHRESVASSRLAQILLTRRKNEGHGAPRSLCGPDVCAHRPTPQNHCAEVLVPPVLDSAVNFRIAGSAKTEMHRYERLGVVAGASPAPGQIERGCQQRVNQFRMRRAEPAPD